MKRTTLIIYPKDVQRITGKSYRHSLNTLRQVRKMLHKEDHHLVSIQDFCDCTGLRYEHVEQWLSV